MLTNRYGVEIAELILRRSKKFMIVSLDKYIESALKRNILRKLKSMPQIKLKMKSPMFLIVININTSVYDPSYALEF